MNNLLKFLIISIVISSISSGCSDSGEKTYKIHTKSTKVYSISLSGSDVYACGIWEKCTYHRYSHTTEDNHENYEWGAGYWKNGEWNSLPLPNDSQGEYDTAPAVTSLAISGSDVYAIGWGYNRVACCWKNGVIYNLPPLELNGGSFYNSISVSGGNVYIGGSSYKAAIKKACYWINGVVHELPPIDSGKDSDVTSITVYGGNVYSSGWSYNSSDTKIACCWINDTLTELTSEGNYHRVSSIAVSEGDVCISGYRQNDWGNSYGCYWKNDNQILLPTPVSKMISQTTSIAVSGGDVYVTGWYYNINGSQGDGTEDGTFYICYGGYWKNNIWVDLTSNYIDFYKKSADDLYYGIPVDPCSSVVVSGGDVYVGGSKSDYIKGEDDDRYIYNSGGYWKNGIWNELPFPEGI